MTIDTTMADKDQLIEFAKTEYKVTIDPRTKIETIRIRVQGLIDGVSADAVAEDIGAPASTEHADGVRWVKSVVNNGIYEFHEFLVGAEFIPCDADGNIV